jgi:tRNA dimethylallyltransferase
MLKSIDAETASKLHPNDVKRVIRAIEIYKVSGLKKSLLAEDFKKNKRYNYFFAVLNPDRKYLYEKINKRTDDMIREGLVAEVDKLIDMGYGSCKSLQAIGYSEILDYRKGLTTLDKAIEKIKQHTRNYAKRQITWFKSVDDSLWFDTDKGEDFIVEEICEKYLRLYCNV